MLAHHSQTLPTPASRTTGRRSPLIAAGIITFLLLAVAGCSENQIYVITDEPGGSSVAGVSLTDAEVDTLATSEAEARALLLNGDYLQAAEVYKKQLPILVNHFIAEYKVGAAYAHAGDVDQALLWLEQSVKKGFANVGIMDNDSALESLHGESRAVPIYRGARENLAALRSRIQLDPWTGTSGPAASFDDLQALLSAFRKEEKRVERLNTVFFPREAALRRVIAHRCQAEALVAFVAGQGDPATREEARVELLRLYRTHTQGPRLSTVAVAKLDEGCRNYINEYPEGRFLPEVKLLHAEYRFLSGLRSLRGPRGEEIPRLCDTFRGEAESILVDSPEDPAAGQALIWLTALDFDPRFGQRDLAGALENYRRLEREYLGLPGVEEQAISRLPALKFFDSGLPKFAVEGIDGEPIFLDRYQGKVLLLFFWSTISKPAKDEIANLKWIEEKFQDRDIVVVGVSLDRSDKLSRSDFSRWVEANNISWPQFYDGNGMDNELARLFDVNKIPFVLVVARDGSLADAGLTGKDLELAVAGIID